MAESPPGRFDVSPVSTARYDLIRFEKLNIKNMTRPARGTVEQPGKNVRAKAGLNRVILAQGWGFLRERTEHKAPGRVEDVPAPTRTATRCGSASPAARPWLETDLDDRDVRMELWFALRHI
ncbi:hypothetical protein [Streptomyces caelestis]|uniref:hypothetical protein n=2 Tax=Streptomyces caelestis TaxID=36816 RepID=UPI0036FBE161